MTWLNLSRTDELLSPKPLTPVTRGELMELLRSYRGHHPDTESQREPEQENK